MRGMERFFLTVSGTLIGVALIRHINNHEWVWAVVDVLSIALLWWVDGYQQQREMRAGHRTTAANCRYWTGDRSPVDWGTCTKCEEAKQREQRVHPVDD
jgi:hypothetical protein